MTICINFSMAFVSLLGFGVPFSTGGRPRFFGFLQPLSSGSSNSSSSIRRRFLRPPFFRTSSSTSSRLPSSIAYRKITVAIYGGRNIPKKNIRIELWESTYFMIMERRWQFEVRSLHKLLYTIYSGLVITIILNLLWNDSEE